MQINLNYQLKIQAWVVALIVITAVAAYFIAKDGWSEQLDAEISKSTSLKTQIRQRDDQLLEKDEAIKQCNSKRIQDSIKNSINNTPNIPADEYMKRYKKLKK